MLRRSERQAPRRRLSNQRTVVWWVPDSDTLSRVADCLRQIDYAEGVHDSHEVGRLVDELTRLPGYPLHHPGDHIEVRVRPRLLSVPKLAGLAPASVLEHPSRRYES